MSASLLQYRAQEIQAHVRLAQEKFPNQLYVGPDGNYRFRVNNRDYAIIFPAKFPYEPPTIWLGQEQIHTVVTSNWSSALQLEHVLQQLTIASKLTYNVPTQIPADLWAGLQSLNIYQRASITYYTDFLQNWPTLRTRDPEALRKDSEKQIDKGRSHMQKLTELRKELNDLNTGLRQQKSSKYDMENMAAQIAELKELSRIKKREAKALKGSVDETTNVDTFVRDLLKLNKERLYNSNLADAVKREMKSCQ